jgi:dGTPase
LRGQQIAEVALVADMLARLELDADLLNSHSDRQRAQHEDAARYWFVRELLGYLINDTIQNTQQALVTGNITSLEHVRGMGHKLVSPSADISDKLVNLKRFLYKNLYYHYRQIRMTKKAERVLEQLFNVYVDTPTMLPFRAQHDAETRGLVRAVTDYLAGMTDRYASEEYRRLFDPNVLT